MTDVCKVPVKAYVGEFTKRGDGMRDYLPSLDPVRVAATYSATSKK